MSRINSDSEQSNSESESQSESLDETSQIYQKEEKIFMRLYPILEAKSNQRNSTNNNNLSRFSRSKERKKSRRYSTLDESTKNQLLDNDGTYIINDIFLQSIIRERCPLNKKIVFLTISKRIKNSSLMEKILNECQLDNGESPENLSYSIAQNMSFVEYKQNKCVFKLGDNSDFLFFIIKGKLKIFQPKTIKALMSLKDYLSYCLMLMNNKEDILLNKMLAKYYNLIPIKIVEEIKKIYHILFKIKLFEKLTQEKITNNKELKLYFDNNNISYEDMDIEKRDLDQLFKYKGANVNLSFQKNIEWVNYILRKCVLSREDKIYFEKFDKIYKSNEKLDIECYIYEFKGFLEEGKYFGDIPIEKNGIITKKKREYTILAEEDSILGKIKNDEFIYIIAPNIKVERIKNQKFINSNYFFKPINSYIFNKNYFHLFLRNEYTREKVLFDINTLPNSLILVQEGNISLTIQCSVIQLNDILQKLFITLTTNKYYQEIFNKKLLTRKIINTIENYGDELIFKKLKLHDERFVKEMKKIRNFQISFVSRDEIIGLEEIFFNIPYITKGVVASEKSVCYHLSLENLEVILKYEGSVEELYFKASVNKLLSMIERLNNIKKSLINLYRNKYENDFYFKSSISQANFEVLENNKISINKEIIKDNQTEKNIKTEISKNNINNNDKNIIESENMYVKKVRYKSPKRGFSSIQNQKIKDIILNSKRNEERESINNISNNSENSKNISNNNSNIKQLKHKNLPYAQSARKLTIKNVKNLFIEPVEQKERAGSVNASGLINHNKKKNNKDNDIDAIFIKDKYYTLEVIKNNLEKNKNKIKVINRIYKDMKNRIFDDKDNKNIFKNEVSEDIFLNQKTLDPNINNILIKKDLLSSKFKSISLKKNIDNKIYKEQGIQANNKNQLKISNNFLLPNSPSFLPKLNIRYDDKKINNLNKINTLNTLNTLNLNSIRNCASSEIIIDKIIAKSKNKKEILPKMVKNFYNDKKIRGYVPFIGNKESNTVFLRKFHKKYQKNYIKTEGNINTLPKILKVNRTINDNS